MRMVFDMRPGWRFAALTASVRSAHCAAGADRGGEDRRPCRAPPSGGVHYSLVSRETREEGKIVPARPMGLSTPRVGGPKPWVCISNQNVSYLTLI